MACSQTCFCLLITSLTSPHPNLLLASLFFEGEGEGDEEEKKICI